MSELRVRQCVVMEGMLSKNGASGIQRWARRGRMPDGIEKPHLYSLVDTTLSGTMDGVEGNRHLYAEEVSDAKEGVGTLL